MTDAPNIAHEQIPGWMSLAELRWLHDTAASFDGPVMWVEIGVCCGKSLFATACGLPDKSTLVAVDLPKPHAPHPGIWTQDDILHIREMVLRAIRERRPDIDLKTLWMPSTDAAKVVRKADVAFIDAAHSYDAVVQDIRAWGQVAPLLCGHDYGHAHHPGVKLAVDELLPQYTNPVGSIWLACD